MATRKHVYYSGRVQGVGFRYTVMRLAEKQAVTGFVRNLRDGRVEVLVEGEESIVNAFIAEIDRVMDRYIEDRSVTDEPPTGKFDGFRVTFHNL